jgi:hypothetical protein
MAESPNDTLADLFRGAALKPGNFYLTEENQSAIIAVVRHYVTGTPADRSRIQAWADARDGSLVTWGENFASFAVREQDPTWIELGFVALATSVLVAHPKRNARTFALLWHSAGKLGVDPDEFCARVERLVGGRRAETLAWYRADGDKDIAVFGMEEGTCPKGFLYTSFK